jgi:hypothetical protein
VAVAPEDAFASETFAKLENSYVETMSMHMKKATFLLVKL